MRIPCFLLSALVCSAVARCGEQAPASGKDLVLTFEETTQEGDTPAVTKEVTRSAVGLALFRSNTPETEFPPHGWVEKREAVKLEVGRHGRSHTAALDAGSGRAQFRAGRKGDSVVDQRETFGAVIRGRVAGP